jgi:uroporphyrinogen-III decarboxylase
LALPPRLFAALTEVSCIGDELGGEVSWVRGQHPVPANQPQSNKKGEQSPPLSNFGYLQSAVDASTTATAKKPFPESHVTSPLQHLAPLDHSKGN